MYKYIAGVVIAVLLAGGAWLILRGSVMEEPAPVVDLTPKPSPNPPAPDGLRVTIPGADGEQTVTPEATGMPVPGDTVGEAETAVVREFTVTGTKFNFEPAEMRVKAGETVRVKFVNADGTHDWRLDEFNAATAILRSPAEETIEFIADKTGTYEYYCSVGNHRELGMVGTFVVEE